MLSIMHLIFDIFDLLTVGSRSVVSHRPRGPHQGNTSLVLGPSTVKRGTK